MGATRRCSAAPTNVPIQWKIQDRVPMNQIAFDSHFGRSSPKAKNLFVVQATRLLERAFRPFTSIFLFWKTFVSFVPILKWLPKYTIKRNLTGDITGGLMVGIVHVPQVRLHSICCTGWCSSCSGSLYVILSRASLHVIRNLSSQFARSLKSVQQKLTVILDSTHTVLHPAKIITKALLELGAFPCKISSFAVVAIMTGNVVSKYAVPSDSINVTAVNVSSVSSEHAIEPVEVTTVLSLAAGLTQIIVAIVGLDFVTTYFSEQLVAGFTTGAGMHALVTQFKDVFGIYDTPRRSGVGTLVRRVIDIAAEIYRTNLAALLATAIATALLLFGNLCINPFMVKHSPVPIPFELLLVIAGAVASWLLDLETKFDVKTVGVIETGLPLPKLPRWELLSHVALDAIPIAIVVMAVHVSMAKLLAKKHNYTIDLKQEFFAVGFTSTISIFFPVFPCCCSLARTVLNSQTGGNTQGILASIIITALFDIFSKFKQLPMLWSVSKTDFAIWVVAFTTTAFIGPEWHVLGNLTGTAEYMDVERYKQIRIAKDIIVIRFDAPLLFTNVDRFQGMIEAVYQKWEKATCNSKADEYDDSTPSENEHKEGLEKSIIPDKFLIIDCSVLLCVDVMGVNCLKEVHTSMQQKGVEVMFASAKDSLLELFEMSWHHDSGCKANFYPTLHDAMYFAQHKMGLAGLKRVSAEDNSPNTTVIPPNEEDQDADIPTSGA